MDSIVVKEYIASQEKIDLEFHHLSRVCRSDNEVIEARKKLIEYIIVHFGKWKEDGDCIPEILVSGDTRFSVKQI